MVDTSKPVSINEVYILTTSRGKSTCVEALFGLGRSDQPGWFHRFCSDYDFKDILFTQDHFIVFGATDGLEDIRTHADNSVVANQIISFIREKTEDPETALHCSIAGGRKTMGVHLAMALQIYGRPQDTLSHVLVNQEFESCPEFFYKPPANRRIKWKLSDGSTKTLYTKNALVELVRMPYISLREYINPQENLLLEQAVKLIQNQVDACPKRKISLNYEGKIIIYGGKRISFRPIDLAFYSVFVILKKMCSRKNSCADCTGCYLSMHEGFFDEKIQRFMVGAYREIMGESSGRLEKFRLSIAVKQSDFFTERKSRVNRVLKKNLLPNEYALLKVENKAEGKDVLYGITLDKEMIE